MAAQAAAAAISGAGQAASGLIGSIGQIARKRKGRRWAQNLQAIGYDISPEDLAQIEYMAEFEPELLDQAIFDSMQSDPRIQQAYQAQEMGLEQLMQIGTQGGYTDVDRAQLQQSGIDTMAAVRGERQAAEQRARMRGTGGSGFQQAQNLLAGQGGATMASRRGLDIAARGQDRALQGLIAGGQLAGGIRQQGMNLAQGRLGIEQFNRQLQQQGLQGRMAAQAANVEAANALAMRKAKEEMDEARERRAYEASSYT